MLVFLDSFLDETDFVKAVSGDLLRPAVFFELPCAAPVDCSSKTCTSAGEL